MFFWRREPIIPSVHKRNNANRQQNYNRQKAKHESRAEGIKHLRRHIIAEIPKRKRAGKPYKRQRVPRQSSFDAKKPVQVQARQNKKSVQKKELYNIRPVLKRQKGKEKNAPYSAKANQCLEILFFCMLQPIPSVLAEAMLFHILCRPARCAV